MLKKVITAVVLIMGFISGISAGGVAESKTKAGKTWPDCSLRGLCVGLPRITMTEEKTWERLKEWNVNVITINFTYDKHLADMPDSSTLSQVSPEMEPYRCMLDRLDKIIVLAKRYNTFIVLEGGAAVGSDKINVAQHDIVESTENAERAYLKNVIDLHMYLGKKYANEPAVLAYNFISEPHTPWIVKNWQTEVVPSFIKAIRSVDKNTFLIFSAGLWGFPEFFDTLTPFQDPVNKTLYGFHDYAPHNYTHQGIVNRPRGLEYPGILKMFDSRKSKFWDRKTLYEYMKPAIDFKKKYNVKMYVGEFGVVRWAPGRAQWVEDMCSLFEENKIDWTFHSYTGWNGWNLTFPADAKESNEPDGRVETERLKVLKKYWMKNYIAPR